jgi:hypothetical protein
MNDMLKSMFPNMNLDIGIHYGTISQNALSMERMDDWYDNDAMYDEIKQEIEDGITGVLSDYLDPVDIQETIDTAIDRFSENYQNDEPQFYYDDDEYVAIYSQILCCWIIEKSPYYTFCKGCSPCVPNAGDLDSPVTPDCYDEHDVPIWSSNVMRAYCLPKEFFEDDKAPYEYFEVNKYFEVKGHE